MDNWKTAAKDLEFEKIIALHEEQCISESGQTVFSKIKPTYNFKEIQARLKLIKDYMSLYHLGLSVPRLEFEELTAEFKILSTKGAYLSAEGVLRIRSQNNTLNGFLSFCKPISDKHPYFNSLFQNTYSTKEIQQLVDTVFNANGEIKDAASHELLEIRTSIAFLKRQVNQNFQRELKKLQGKGMLSEYNENFVNGRRTLSVLSRYKRDIGGLTLGSSNTGSLVFIEPQINVPLNNEITLLEEEEKREIIRILIELTKGLQQFQPLIIETNKVLIRLDVLQAIYRVARKWEGIVPRLSETPEIHIQKGFHPLLVLSNQEKNTTTVPQTFELHPEQRILVISGPNAGGKSITLKTVGLLQLMFQCGLPIPCHPDSSLGLFNQIFTDIGDNQSIENQLSTYSYRLKKMKEFLDLSNRKTLLLLDEFGTGSDPELGGALAEVFFEDLYQKNIFGVITTHYSNIKLRTEQMPQAVNACMLFDEKNLQPLYQLSVGQAGSSFTFEVARINGLSKELIDKARSYLSGKKLKLDKTLSTLQKEKSIIQKERKALESKRVFFEKSSDLLDKAREYHESKVNTLHSLVTEKQALAQKGARIDQWIQNLPQDPKKRKSFIQDLVKYLAKEQDKTRLKEAQVSEVKGEKKKGKTPVKKANSKVKKKINQNLQKIKVGSTVRILDGTEKGEVIAMKKEEAEVGFGMIRMTLPLEKLVYLND